MVWQHSGMAHSCKWRTRCLPIGRRFLFFAVAAGMVLDCGQAQTSFTWQQVKEKFEATNPTLKAAQTSIDESRAAEITAYLRPNPDLTGVYDQIDIFSKQPSTKSAADRYSPFAYSLPSGSISYLHERQHKRELRRDTARESTAIAESTYLDQERSLLFNLRSAFVQTLQAKAVLQNAKENLEYWDKELDVNRTRYKAGDLALVDLNRLELQRVQFESDYETALVNLRTNKIQLLMLLNDRTPIEQFDVTGPFDFPEQIQGIDGYRKAALDARPDLKAAIQNVELARLNHQLAVANGSTDPTFSMDFARNPPIPVYIGLSVSIPLRIFDRNQGEKARTQLDYGRRPACRGPPEPPLYCSSASPIASPKRRAASKVSPYLRWPALIWAQASSSRSRSAHWFLP